MRIDVRYAQLIPMVQGVVGALDSGIEAEEAAGAELARVAGAMTALQGEGAAALLRASRRHAVKVLEMQGKRAALLAQYGLD